MSELDFSHGLPIYTFDDARIKYLGDAPWVKNGLECTMPCVSKILSGTVLSIGNQVERCV
jgi:hypothetical protein